MTEVAVRPHGSGHRPRPRRGLGRRALQHALATATATALGIDAYVQLTIAWSRRTAARSTVAGSVADARDRRRGIRLGHERRTGAALPLLAAVTSVALGLDTYVHLTTASSYSANGGAVLNEGHLFIVEALAAAAAAVLLLLRPAPAAWLLALAVAATALASVLLATYVHIGAIGPIPDLYEPTWNVPGKVLATAAEGGAAAGSLVGLTVARAARPFSRGVSQP